MSAPEYVEVVLRPTLRTNQTNVSLLELLKYQDNWVVNMSKCELCGAVHSVFSNPHQEPSIIRHLAFYFSGTSKPSAKDKKFIEDFRQRFFGV